MGVWGDCTDVHRARLCPPHSGLSTSSWCLKAAVVGTFTPRELAKAVTTFLPESPLAAILPPPSHSSLFCDMFLKRLSVLGETGLRNQ